MKILYYCAHPYLNLTSMSGYGTHMREMIHAFRELGHEVKPVIMGGTESSDSHAAHTGGMKEIAKSLIPRRTIEWLKDWQLLRFDRHAKNVLTEAVTAFSPDLIYERAAYLQLSGVETARAHQIPHILEINAPFAEESKELRGPGGHYQKALTVEKAQMKMSDLNVFVSTALRDYALEHYGLPIQKTLITPNAINPNHQTVDWDLVAKCKAQYGWTSDQPIIGFVGSIFPWHGVDLLIHAFEEVTNEFPEARLLIVGDGEILPELKSEVVGKAIESKIIFTGKVPHQEVFSYIHLMDITVMAKSNWYGSPVKIFEYGVMGKAIIAPDNVPVRDVMVDQEDGLLVDAEKSQLVAALKMYLKDAQMRARIGQHFQKKVKTKHLWEANARHVLEALTAEKAYR